MGSDRGKDWLVGGAIFLLAVGIYAGSLGNGFVLDDKLQIEHNPLIADLRNVPVLLRSDYWEPALQRGLYRPAVTISYALDYAAGGLDPAGYHAVNVLLHGANSVGVWVLLRLLLGSPMAAASAAALFAAHAVHTEAVAAISMGRPELMCCFFFLGALLAHLARERTRLASPTLLLATSLLCYGLALASKESAITLLGVLVVVHLVGEPGATTQRSAGARRRATAGRFGGTAAAYLAVTALYAAARWLALRDGVVVPPSLPLDNPLVELGAPWRLMNVLHVAWRYLELLVWPVHLSYDYSFDQIPMLRAWSDTRALGVGIGAVLAVGLVAWSRRVPALLLSVLFAVVTFSVASNLVVPIGTILGERLLYLPSIGFCAAVAVGAERLGSRIFRASPRRGVILAGLLSLVVGLHGWRAVQRTSDWSSRERLYLHDVDVVPWSAKAQNNAGFALSHQGQTAEARTRYETAIGILPAGYAMPYANLGGLLVREEDGDPRLGVALLEKALELQPEHPPFLAKLGWGYFRLGRLEEARARLQRALELDPSGAAAVRHRRQLEAVEAARRGRSGLGGRSMAPAPGVLVR